MDARNHQPCNYAVSCTKLIPNLNLAEGRNSITGSQPKVRSFSSSICNGFTELKKARITGFAVRGDPPRFLFYFLFVLIIQGITSYRFVHHNNYRRIHMARLDKMPENERSQLLCLPCPTIESTPWVAGPPLTNAHGSYVLEK